MYSELTKMEEKRIVIRTFSYFDIFVDGETIPFSCKKAKELLALLVDRRRRICDDGGCNQLFMGG